MYKYVVDNNSIDEVMKYLDQAEKNVQKLKDYAELKSYVYSVKSRIQIEVGDIKNAKSNIQKAEQARPNTLKTFLGAGAIEYHKSLILLAEGKYQEALNMISIDIDIDDTNGTKKGLYLAPEYLIQASILNYLQRFKEAYTLINDKVYRYINKEHKNQSSIFILSRTFSELSRSELGLGQKEKALSHAIEAVNILIEDESRNNKKDDLDDSTDVFLAHALVAKADALSAVGNIKEAMDIYILVKNIYWNVYGIKNIGNMDNVGYAFAQAAKTAVSLSDKNDSHIQCFYFYSLLRDYFGIDHHRTKEVQGICP